MTNSQANSLTVAVMQPYFFPYIGYFQLIAAADVFVVFSDAQYIERGWSNRNRILVNGTAHMITLPVVNAPRHLPYGNRHYRFGGAREKILKTISLAYAKAPFFDEAFPVIDEIMACADCNVAVFNRVLIMTIAERLGVKRKSVYSSDLLVDGRGQDRILAICEKLGASRYVNAIGGVSLYEPEAFSERGIDLAFVRSRPVSYPQFGGEHVPWLSIIDVLMFNGFEGTAALLDQYDLIGADGSAISR